VEKITYWPITIVGIPGVLAVETYDRSSRAISQTNCLLEMGIEKSEAYRINKELNETCRQWIKRVQEHRLLISP
jgi:hypothetical protein